ncbi:50S ribosomal protein L9 [Achromatium sp. WMS3]|nr:50S ribosomal protein L9 [Achromatium sp. WMS3]
MEVILLKKVENLGSLGDKVTVRPGYGRNYLLPTGHAIVATDANIKVFEERRTELERQAFALLADAEERKEQLIGLKITVARRAGTEGRLFGSVGNADIAAALQTVGYPVEKHEIRLAQGPLRTTGEHDVGIHLHTGVDVAIKVEIISEE